MAYNRQKNDDLTDFSQIAEQAAGSLNIVRASDVQRAGSAGIVRPDVPSDDDNADGSLRPKMLDEFLGQK